MIGKKQNLSPEARERKRQFAKLYLKWPVDKPRPKRTEEWKSLMRQKMTGRKITWDTKWQISYKINGPKLRAANLKRQKRVVGDDGTIFPSVSNAYKTLGVSERGFRDCVNNHWRVKGRYWTIEQTNSL